MQSSQEKWIIGLRIAGILPVLIYPAVLIASVMGLASPNPSGAELFFYWGTLLYPLVYIGCFIAGMGQVKRGDATNAIRTSALPVAFIGLLTLLFIAVT